MISITIPKRDRCATAKEEAIRYTTVNGKHVYLSTWHTKFDHIKSRQLPMDAKANLLKLLNAKINGIALIMLRLITLDTNLNYRTTFVISKVIFRLKLSSKSLSEFPQKKL